MKVLIWVLCIFANAFITTLFKESGIILGGIPTVILFAITLWLARTLCKMWDKHKAPKALEHINNNTNSYYCPICGSMTPKDKGYCTECGAKIVNHQKNLLATETTSQYTPTNNTPILETQENTEPTLFCRKCGEKLLDNSRFCRKCGTESISEASTVVPEKTKETVADDADTVSEVSDELSFDDMTPDDALKEILKMQEQEAIKLMEANSQSQPDNEGAIDFGLVPEKPIFTYALMSVEGEEEYLNKLYTVDGQKIKYDRSGSMAVEGINGMVDIYDTFLPSGQFYKTIYINMYGAKSSPQAPTGFCFTPQKTLTPSVKKLTGLLKCPDCGKEFSARIDACPNCSCPKSAILEELEAQKKQNEKE